MNTQPNTLRAARLFSLTSVGAPMLAAALLTATAAVATEIPAAPDVESATLAPVDVCTMAVEVESEGTNYGWIMDLTAMDPAQLTAAGETMRVAFDERHPTAMTGYVAECDELSECVELRLALSPAIDDGTPIHLVGPQTDPLFVTLESGDKTTSDLVSMLERRAAKCGG